MTHAYDASQRDEASSIAVIHRSLDLGATLIDTADIYGPFTRPSSTPSPAPVGDRYWPDASGPRPQRFAVSS